MMKTYSFGTSLVILSVVLLFAAEECCGFVHTGSRTTLKNFSAFSSTFIERRRNRPLPSSYWRHSVVVYSNSNHAIDQFSAEEDDDQDPVTTKTSAFPTTLTKLWIATLIATATVGVSTSNLPMSTAMAYDNSDYASETVTQAIDTLKAAHGNVEETFKAYENVAAIITEGKGVGGAINYQGIKLERGYIADEDTTIYNPGLTLLTESEKERLVEAVINARKAGLNAQAWNDDNEYGFGFLKEKLDPWHIVELGGFLKVMPFYAAFLYLVAFGVQQVARGFFPVVYLLCAAAFFAPIIILVGNGPP